MISRSENKLNLGSGLILIFIGLLAIYPIVFVVNFLTFPFPLEYRDAAIVSAARDISQGINFYRLYTYPDHIYLYGFLYPLLIAPFYTLFTHPILAARLIDVIFLGLFLAMSFDIFRTRGASINSSLIGVLILLNSTCLIWKIDGSRPDISGLFFAILAIYILMKRGFSLFNILVSAAVSVTGFYFKQYMLFSVPVITAFLFLFQSKKKGLIFGFAASVMLATSFLLAWHFLPLLYEYTILHNIIAERVEFENLVDEIRDFFGYYWPLFFGFFYVSYKRISNTPGKGNRNFKLNLVPLDLPLIQRMSMSLVDMGFLVSTLLLIFLLGGHRGNTYIYFGELLLPFLLFITIPGLDRWIEEKSVLTAAQFLILLFAVFSFFPEITIDFAGYRHDFEVLYARAEECEEIYDMTPLIAMYKIENERYPIYSNGHRGFAHLMIAEPNTISSKFARIQPELLEEQLAEWNRRESMRVQNQEFDCIFSDSDHPINGIDGYKMVDEFDSLRRRKVFLWVPVGTK
jgi:hypothetical protein